MESLKLYNENVYLTKTVARIMEINKDGIVFDKTIFFPEGGGQSCDVGVARKYEKDRLSTCACDEKFKMVDIVDVQEANSKISHKIGIEICQKERSQQEIAEMLGWKVGDDIELKINWAHRFDNMQRHAGEHIVSGLFFREYHVENKGFHMGDNYIAIDMQNTDEKGKPTGEEITEDVMKRIEFLANESIWQDLPICWKEFINIDKTKNLPIRKMSNITENIRVVYIGKDINDSQNLVDCVACCGTHPSSTGQVGMISLYKIEKNKNMFRIYMEAGKRAFENYRLKQDVITKLSLKYSTQADGIEEKVAKEEKKYETLKKKFLNLSKEMVKVKSEEVMNKLKNEKKCVFYFEGLDVGNIIKIGNNVLKFVEMGGEKNNELHYLALIEKENCTLVLFSLMENVDVGDMTKTYAKAFGGKGGGKKNMARIKFENMANLQGFIAEISQNY